ncbi:MAG: Ig-like domain-containing protein [Ginsengibacter sp.]
MKKNYSSPGGTPMRTCKSCSRNFNKLFLILLLVVFAAGCKKVTEEAGLTGICPTVSLTNPLDKAVGVSLNTRVEATFNEAMNPATINGTTYTLKEGSTVIPGLVTYTGNMATFTPATSLLSKTIYTATISTGAKDLARNSMVNDYVWSFTTGDPDLTPPTVIVTDPADAAIGVAFDKKISATFSEMMDSLSTTTSFTITNTTSGGTNVIGSVTYSGTTAVFLPAANLAPSTTYTGTITTGAKDLSGNFLAHKYIWNFTTSGPITPPIVISTDPVNGTSGVILNKMITATFSKQMDPATINNTTFLLKQGVNPIAGVVTYTATTATFTPSSNLIANTTYTGTITTGSKDLAGNAMVNNYIWSFATALSVTPPSYLGSASVFGAFGGNAGITNQGLKTMINNGGIGSTAASSLITGFHDGLTGDIYTETPLNVGNATGGIYTAAPAPGNAVSAAIAAKALLDANAAYISISPASKPGGIDPGAGELGGLTLAPGIYKSASGTFKISNGDLTLDAQGDPNAVWIFQTAAGLTVGIAGPAGARSVVMINGGLPKNVYWYVGSAATINGAGGGVMTGTIIATAGVTFSTPGNAVQTVLNGRAISLVASVTMVNTTVNVPN